MVLPRGWCWALGVIVAGGLTALLILARAAAASGNRSKPSPTATNGSPAGVSETRAKGAARCPDGMLLIEGNYCPNVRHNCMKWVDPPGPYAHTRCAEFASTPRCDGARERVRFCIDPHEAVAAGETFPHVNVDWNEAQDACRARGARLCKESEWQFACEGEAMLAYPYGFKRDSKACNFDMTSGLGRPGSGLADHRAKANAFPRCVSPFGVHDMVGNVDEWTERAGQRAPHRAALHGGWWLPGRNSCRAATLGHDENYKGRQVGFRCCREAT